MSHATLKLRAFPGGPRDMTRAEIRNVEPVTLAELYAVTDAPLACVEESMAEVFKIAADFAELEGRGLTDGDRWTLTAKGGAK